MKKVIILGLALVIAALVGCSEEEQPPESSTYEAVEQYQSENPDVMIKIARIDPVSGNPVEITETAYTYVYNDVQYPFESKGNMDKFVENPEKYLYQE